MKSAFLTIFCVIALGIFAETNDLHFRIVRVVTHLPSIPGQTNELTVTNFIRVSLPPVVPPPTNSGRTQITLAWNQQLTATNPGGVLDHSAMSLAISNRLLTNHLVWSTNSPQGPWTGDVPIVCTNTNMQANLNLDLNVKALWFKLGTNSVGL